ncbi:hypothetical protein [Pseudoalteromonas sp. ASV78]|uniref:hypothetical protein n=1 Tax=Pseudoalteromonas sp. ASV78 TaxID=3397851 RepID=UPI0039FDD705
MINKITMPKACISCQAYKHIGKTDDPHCPHTDWRGQAKTKTRYGKCQTHGTQVFITELCNQYQQEPFIEVVDADNRPTAKQPRQERLAF